MADPTPPTPGPMVGNRAAADRLMTSVRHRRPSTDPETVISRLDVADVLSALADYTMWLAALDYSPDGPGRTGYATSACRFLHAVADDLTYQLAPSYPQVGSSREPASADCPSCHHPWAEHGPNGCDRTMEFAPTGECWCDNTGAAT